MTTTLIRTIQRFMGLSTDTKPTTDIPVGSEFYEHNTGLTYIYDGSAWTSKPSGLTSVAVNSIGTPGEMGFGVGICPPGSLPSGMTPMPGYNVPGDPNYGNYQFSDGSVMVWIPKFYYRMHEWATSATKQFTANRSGAGGPTQIDLPTHGLSNGDKIFIFNVAGTGWTALNGLVYTITVAADPNSFTIPVDSSGYGGAAASTGECCKGFGADFEFNRTLVTHLKNSIAIKGTETYANEAAANAAYYALHRAFIDGGIEQPGFFVDKYMCSKNALGVGFVASSIANGKPLSSASTHNPFADCTGGANTYASAIDLAHRRDGVAGAVNASSIFFCTSRFIYSALAMLSVAHGQRAQNDTWCAWYSTTVNYPKGCNSNALKDVDDATVIYTSDGYSNCGRTGSGVSFAKTTHNGQVCGVADLNGLMYEVSLGVTCIASNLTITAVSAANPCEITTSAAHGLTTGDRVMILSIAAGTLATALNAKLWTITTTADPAKFTIAVDSSSLSAWVSGGTVTKGVFYVAKTTTAMKTFTNGAAADTDHWGATGVAAMMDAFVPAFVSATGGAHAQRFGSGVNQVLSESLSGAGRNLTGLGFPKDANGMDPTGTNLFGKDYYYQYIINDLCLISCAYWDAYSGAGVWDATWLNSRTTSSYTVGFRAACYPV